jgi:hypothetical protein
VRVAWSENGDSGCGKSRDRKTGMGGKLKTEGADEVGELLRAMDGCKGRRHMHSPDNGQHWMTHLYFLSAELAAQLQICHESPPRAPPASYSLA